MAAFGPNLSGSGCGLVSGLCGYGNGGSGSINSSNIFKREEILASEKGLSYMELLVA